MENWAKKFENLKNLVEKKVAKLKDFLENRWQNLIIWKKFLEKKVIKFENLKFIGKMDCKIGKFKEI